MTASSPLVVDTDLAHHGRILPFNHVARVTLTSTAPLPRVQREFPACSPRWGRLSTCPFRRELNCERGRS